MSFEQILSTLKSGISQFGWNDLADILLVTFLIYKLVSLTKGSRAYEVLKGVAILLLVSVITQLLSFYTVSWVLQSILQSGSIIIILFILFTPEIRRMLEKLGTSGKRLGMLLTEQDQGDITLLVKDLTNTFMRLSRRRVGALVVFERKTGLADIISTGTRIEGTVSGALLENIFEPNTPLHDGAVICRGSTISAAACFLPLSDEDDVERELGTRHRAALGVSSVSDCIVIVVSEETGTISVAQEGRLTRYMTEKSLSDLLQGILMKKELSSAFSGKLKKGGRGE